MIHLNPAFNSTFTIVRAYVNYIFGLIVLICQVSNFRTQLHTLKCFSIEIFPKYSKITWFFLRLVVQLQVQNAKSLNHGSK